MTTLIASLIAASAALAVMVFDRVWSAHEQRRAERRQIYAQFLAACWESFHLDLLIEGAPDIALQRAEAVGARYAEVELIAPRDVQMAAEKLAAQIFVEGQSDFGPLRGKFIDAARRDLGERS